MKPTYLAALFPVLLAACSGTGSDYQPITDGTRAASWDSDLTACQTLARNQGQFDDETAGAAAMGAGAGALLGAMDDDGDALGGALVGAVAGGAAGAVSANDRRQSIVTECMRGRGHNVVG
ncbi:glycine zipper family protein [Amaricoccus tamworthensis]|uniref:glycine zipper family protein n=1 Tax=Amaricoccus tamworthensis TaxID=57002 RepID=UPI003C7C3A2B